MPATRTNKEVSFHLNSKIPQTKVAFKTDDMQMVNFSNMSQNIVSKSLTRFPTMKKNISLDQSPKLINHASAGKAFKGK